MIRKTLWRTLIVLTILSMSVPLVQAAPRAAGQPKERPAPPLTSPERTLLPGWAAVAEMPAATIKTAPVILFANGFEGNFASEWIVQDVVGLLGEWTRVSSSTGPDASPHSGDFMAKFNSYDESLGYQTRVYTTGLSLSAPNDLYAGFWMHHAENADGASLQLEVDNGSGWADVGSAIACQGVTGWQYHVVDLSLYAGDVISLSFRGLTDYSANIYLDDVEVYHTPPEPGFAGSSKTAAADFDAWTITYTVAISNSGQVNAASVYLTDTLPANTAYVASSALASSGTITEGIGYLEWGGTVFSQTAEYLTFTVDILGAPIYDINVTNTAWITDPAASDWISAQVVVSMPPFVPDLSTSVKETVPENAQGGRRAAVGAQFPYTITISNTGPASATNAMLTDTFPTGSASYALNTDWADSGNLIVASDMLTWTGVVTNGEDVRIGFMMDAISLGLSVDNTAWITGDGTLLDVDAPSVGIQNPNAYCGGATVLDPSGGTYWGTIVTYDDDDAFWDSGEDVWFTLTPTATGVVTLATETGSDVAIGTSDGGCGGAFTTLASVDGSGAVSVSVDYNQLYYITVDDTGDYTLTLEVEYEPLQPRLDGWKQGPALVVAGDLIPYTVNAENYGESQAAAASIVDVFPSGTVGPATNVVVDGPGSIVTNDAGGLEWNGVLAVSEGVTITFELSPTLPCLEPVMTNTTVISDPAASMAVIVEAPPVETFLSIPYVSDFEMDDGGLTVQGFDLGTGAPVTSAWEWGTPVSGPSAAHSGDNVWATNLSGYFDDAITDILTTSYIDLSAYSGGPLYLEYWDWRNHFMDIEWAYVSISSTSSGGWVELWADHVDQQTWTLHQFDIGSLVSPGDLVQVNFSWVGNGDSLTIDGWYMDDIVIYENCPPIVLSMSKLGPGMAAMGEVMTYTILVENNGPTPATGVELTDYLDPGTIYAGGALANHGVLDDSQGAAGVITWTGSVTYTEPLTLTIPVAAGGGCGGSVTNTAILTHTSLDAELQDSAATVLYSDLMEVDKSGPLTAPISDVVQMQIVLSSTMYAPGTIMTDTIPPGMEYAGNLQASDGVAWYDSGDDAVYWTTAVLILPSQMTGITITFDVTITASSGPVTNTVDAEYCDRTISDTHTIEAWTPCNPVTDADFDHSPAVPEVGATVYFSGLVASGDAPITYTWDFGDGGVGTGVNAVHVYTGAGDFVVELTVNNDCGADVYTGTVSTIWPCESLGIDKSGPLTATSGTVVQMQVVISSAFFAPGTVLTDVLPLGMEYAGNVDATDGVAWYDAGVVYWTTDEPIPGMPVTDGPAGGWAETPVCFHLFEGVESRESFRPDWEAHKYELLSPLFDIDVLTDGRFEAGTPNSAWNEASINFGTPICDVVSRGGTGDGTGPHSGDWWACFGGSENNKVASVDQDVTIPVGDASLSFWLEIPRNDAPGALNVSLDGDVLFSASDTDGPAFAVYDQVVLDVGDYADGGVHNLRFVGDTTAGTTNFFVDDVVLDVVLAPMPISITFDVTLTASSGDVVNTAEAEYCNGIVSDTHTIAVWPSCNPVTGADFDYSPAEPEKDETVYFSATVASGDAPIIYTWDFGDGGTATGVNATHTFTQSGDYTVWMTATNCGGAGVSVISHTVTVTGVACEAVTDVSFDHTPAKPVEDEMIVFNAIYTSTNATSATLSYSWDFDSALKTGASVTYTYAATGTYGITLTVANACTVPPVEYVGYVTVFERIMYAYLPLVVKD